MLDTPVLFDQLLSPIRAFTLFLKLPIELRLAIWHFTFPPPGDIYIGERWVPYRWPTSGPPVRIIPVTLWVNRESRMETLEHYCLFEGPFALGRRELLRTCFNPSKDIFYLSGDEMFPWFDEEPALEDHLSTLSREAPRKMEEILQIRITDFSRYGRCGVSELFSVVKSESGAAVQGYTGAYSSAIFHFPCLKKITLQLSLGEFDDQGMKAIADVVTAFVALHREKFRGGKAPQVIFYGI